MTTVLPRAAAAPGAKSKGPNTGGLYKKREPIHPQRVHGPWRKLKWAMLILTLGIYYTTPWIRWPRTASLPQQAVLVDTEHGRFWFFGIHLWSEEVYYLAGLLVLAALALFLVTALFGRLWCGYSCPQTVWTDLYMVVERLFEGDRNARLRLDKAKWSFGKLVRKTGKHTVWLLIGLVTGGAWIFYFRDAPTLWGELWSGKARFVDYLWVGGLTASTYLLAGTMREQVCTYMCPWPRIQGAMVDDQSLQVTYRWDRGEPRAPHKKGEDWTGRGDCVDCKACVVACPMGIDIREGMQLECINCALCIDACDAIMVKVERPKGLIAFDTDAAVLARAEGRKAKYRFLRPRTLYYALLLAVTAGLMGWGLTIRPELQVSVQKDRSPLFVRLKDGRIRDGYTVELQNRGVEPGLYSLAFTGPRGADVRAAGLPAGAPIAVEPGQSRSLRVFVTAPPTGLLADSAAAVFTVRNLKTGSVAAHGTVFFAEGASG